MYTAVDVLIALNQKLLDDIIIIKKENADVHWYYNDITTIIEVLHNEVKSEIFHTEGLIMIPTDNDIRVFTPINNKSLGDSEFNIRFRKKSFDEHVFYFYNDELFKSTVSDINKLLNMYINV